MNSLLLASIALALSSPAFAIEERPLKVIKVVSNGSASGFGAARSEGLDFYDGALWRSEEGAIAKIDPADGSILASYEPPNKWTEGLTWFEGRLWHLSEAVDRFYIGSFQGASLEFEESPVRLPEAGWGLTNDGSSLIYSEQHSATISYVDPKSLAVGKRLHVTLDGEPLWNIEDLEWDGHSLWCSSLMEKYPGRVFRIDPSSGRVTGAYFLPDPSFKPWVDGIAFDGKTLWITGKRWNGTYQVELPD
jgi:glutaminyl-peptide cyclotransferase